MRATGAFLAGLAIGVIATYAALSSRHTAPDRPVTTADQGPAASLAPAVPMLPAPSATPPPDAPSVAPGGSAAPVEPFVTQPVFAVPPATLNPDSQVPQAPAAAPLPKESMPPAATDASDLERLRARNLTLPVAGVEPKALRDTFAQMRGTRVHEAIDILAPRGTPVLAAGDGTIAKLFNSAAGGLTVYEFDPEKTYCYYYAHLDRYAEGLHEGQAIARGQRLGDVGTTGNAPPDAPHLHFTVFKLGADKRWWEGTALNPYPLWAMSR
jgi:murein DD-endopeptidase MepM/ murein hydrolase activator NlpD